MAEKLKIISLGGLNEIGKNLTVYEYGGDIIVVDLGMGFPECLEGGASLSKDDLLARGVNQSSTHVDFMVGADDLNIYGVSADGSEVPVFVNGQWAWE